MALKRDYTSHIDCHASMKVESLNASTGAVWPSSKSAGQSYLQLIVWASLSMLWCVGACIEALQHAKLRDTKLVCCAAETKGW